MNSDTQKTIDRFTRAGRPVCWQRSSFDAFLAGHGAARRRADEDRIASLRKAAADSPTALTALAWADSHGVVFYVDHALENAGGVYHAGTGVVGVALSALEKRTLQQPLGYLVHEIRHAWQDHYGLIAIPARGDGGDNIFRDLAVEAFFEADAEAHAMLVRQEYDAVDYARWLGKMDPGMMETFAERSMRRNQEAYLAMLEKDLSDKAAFLREAFLSWFDDPGGFAGLYGRRRAETYAHALRLGPAPKPDIKLEYAPAESAAIAPRDYRRREVSDQLGRSFAGVNYLTSRDMRDFLQREILSPLRLRSFFADAAWDKIPPAGKPGRVQQAIRLVQDVRRAEKQAAGGRICLFAPSAL